MSEQIIQDAAGIGRVISKKITTIEKSTTNFMSLDSRVTQLEMGSGVTPSGILAALITVDGHGSGLDADTLDGFHASAFMTSSTQYAKYGTEATADLNSLTESGMFRINNSNLNTPAGYDWGQLVVTHGGGDTIAQMIFKYTEPEMSIRTGNPIEVGGLGAWTNWAKVWTNDNHGTGSGLDADLLDGKEGSDFSLISHNHNTDYASISHNHNTQYALIAHNHDSSYYNKTEVDGLIGVFDESLMTNGWTKLPNGLIMQWGVRSVTHDGNTYVTFPIAFPHVCFNVTTSLAFGYSVNGDAGAGAYSWNTSGVYLRNGVNVTGNMAWFAIGY